MAEKRQNYGRLPGMDELAIQHDLATVWLQGANAANSRRFGNGIEGRGNRESRLGQCFQLYRG